MAEQRKKSASLLLTVGSINISLELFAALLWPERSSDDGEYRVRIDGRWYSPENKYTFLKADAVGQLVARLLEGKKEFQEEARPTYPKHQRVRVHAGECVEGMPLKTLSGFICAPPFRGVDGRWRVYVLTADGTHEHLCHDVEPLRRHASRSPIELNG